MASRLSRASSREGSEVGGASCFLGSVSRAEGGDGAFVFRTASGSKDLEAGDGEKMGGVDGLIRTGEGEEGLGL